MITTIFQEEYRFQIMKFIMNIIIIFICHTSLGQNSLQDSIIKSATRVVYDFDYRNYGISFLFNKNGTRQEKGNDLYLDTVSFHIAFYKNCDCEISLDDYNIASDQLNQKRINIILKEISKRIDTTGIKLNVYWQNEKKDKDEFDPIFGPDERTIAYAQRSVNVTVNCGKLFYIRNEAEPYTGHHVWTHNGKIHTIAEYKNGLKHGKSYHWSYQNKLSVTIYHEGKAIAN